MRKVFEVIEQLKQEGVIEDYAVAGAVGAIFYVEAFNTQDVDLLVNLPMSLDPLGLIKRRLEELGYTFNSEGHIVIDSWPVQFLPVSDGLTEEAWREAQYLPFDEELLVRVARPEHLAAEALKVGRPKDFQRISMLIECDEFDFDYFKEVIRRFSLEEKWQKMQSVLDGGLK
jgi:tetrahydromethanopterin S-methyltransferase subunit A